MGTKTRVHSVSPASSCCPTVLPSVLLLSYSPSTVLQSDSKEKEKNGAFPTLDSQLFLPNLARPKTSFPLFFFIIFQVAAFFSCQRKINWTEGSERNSALWLHVTWNEARVTCVCIVPGFSVNSPPSAAFKASAAAALNERRFTPLTRRCH